MAQASSELPDSDTAQVACAVDSSSSKNGVDIHSLCRNMDFDGLRLYLCNHVEEQDILHEKTLNALRCAPDPGKLVLDVFQTFHLRFPNKYHTRVNQTTCLFLLRQLKKLSPPITHEVDIEAKNLAAFLKTKLKENVSPTDISGFLQLLAAFKLTSLYNEDELVPLLDKLSCGYNNWREEHLYLCRVLGLSKKIPGITIHFLDRLAIITTNFTTNCREYNMVFQV